MKKNRVRRNFKKGVGPGKPKDKIIIDIKEFVRSHLDVETWYATLWACGIGGIEYQNPVTGLKYKSKPDPEVLFKLATWGFGSPDSTVNVEFSNGLALQKLGEVLKGELADKGGK